MALPLVDVADVLRAAGCDVHEMDGWKQRGETDGQFKPQGLILHHDAEALGWDTNPDNDFNVPEYMSLNGVSGAQLWVARSGTWWILAAGRKWHAGVGQWRSIPKDSGNTYTIGIETDHTTGTEWPAAQLDSIITGSRALVQYYKLDVDGKCCGHKEYAPSRKTDPDGINLDSWRQHLKAAVLVPPAPTETELFTVSQYDDIMAKLNTIAADAAEARLRTRGTNPAIDSFAVLQMGIDSIDGHVLNDAPHWVVSTLQQAISDAAQKILTGILEQPIVSNVDGQTYPLRMLLQAINDHTFKGNAVDQSVTSSVDGKEYSVANILQAVDARVVELLSRIRGDNADLDMPQRAIQSLDAISASVTRIEAQ